MNQIMNATWIQNALSASDGEDISKKYSAAKKRLSSAIAACKAVKMSGQLFLTDYYNGQIHYNDQIIRNFIVLFVLNGASSQVRPKHLTPDKDASSLVEDKDIHKVILQLYDALTIDRLFYQHGAATACKNIAGKLSYASDIKIEGRISNVNWYNPLLDYKRSGVMTAREQEANKEKLSNDSMEDIVDGLATRLLSKATRYDLGSAEERYLIQREVQLTPFEFFLSINFAQSDRPSSSKKRISTPKFDSIVNYLCGDPLDDEYDIDNKWIDFFLNEQSKKYHYKILGKRDLGQAAYAANLRKKQQKKMRLNNALLNKIGSNVQIVSPWSSSWDSECLSADERISNENWDSFFNNYCIKCTHAFNQIVRECSVRAEYSNKTTSTIFPNYSMNLVVFDQLTRFVWLADLWIAKWMYLSSSFERMRTSNIKAVLRDCNILNSFDFDSEGITLLDGCIDLPICLPDNPPEEFDPYRNYTERQERIIEAIAKKKSLRVPNSQPEPLSDKHNLIWL